MIELDLLGTTRVRSGAPDPASLLARRKPFGLLAYLAADPGRYHQRAVVCGLLWPDTDESRARRSLRVALHRLREHLGPEAVRSREDGALGVDPERVTSDVTRLEEAVRIGNAAEAARLYRGPFLDGFHTGAGPFDRWIDERRSELERRATDAVRQGATEALARGEHRHAAALSAELLRIRPTDVVGIETRVESLRRLGAVGRALEDLATFREHFEEELEMPVPERVAGLGAALRKGEPAGTPSSGGVAAADPPGSAPSRASSAGDEPASPSPAPSTRPPGPFSRTAKAAVAGVFAVGGLVALAVLGLPGADGGEGFGPGAPAATREVSAEALRLREEARALRNRGELEASVRLYERIAEIEPEWGEVHPEVVITAHWAGAFALRDITLARTFALGDAVPEPERSLARAFDLAQKIEGSASRGLYLRVLDLRPGDVLANQELGEVEFHWGATLGIPPESARRRFEIVVDSMRNRQALLHLARLDARAGDTAALGARIEELAALGDSPELLEARTLDGVMRGAPPEPERTTLATLYSVAAARAPAGARLAFFEAALPGIEDLQVRASGMILAAQVALSRGRPSEARSWLERLGSISRGRQREFEAAALVLPFRPLSPDVSDSVAPGLLATETANNPSLFELLTPWIDQSRRQFLVFLLQGPAGFLPDTTVFERSGLLGAHHIEGLTRVLRARHLIETGEDYESALEALGQPPAFGNRAYPAVLDYPTAHARYWRARALAGSGREREAITWYRTFPDTQPYDVAFLPGVLLERGRIEARLGMLDEARDSFLHVVELLGDAEPDYWTLLADARRELARLDARR